MDIKEIRRLRLKQWFTDRPIPTKEKSYFSQVLSGKVGIGERAARRIETDYEIPDGYLDIAFTEDELLEPEKPQITVLTTRQKQVLELLDALPDDEVDEFIDKMKERKRYYDKRLLELFNKLSEKNA